MRYIFLVLFFLISFNATTKVLKKEDDSKLKSEKNNSELDDEIRNYFTDEDGNILELSKIPSLKAKIGEWNILVGNVDGRKACYAVSKAFAKVGNHKENRNEYFMVIYFNKKNQKINISTGYNFKQGSMVAISIDGVQFIANTYGDISMPDRGDTDIDIVRHMLHGKKVLVKGDSRIGTYSVDAYSIDEFQEVYSKLVELCDFM